MWQVTSAAGGGRHHQWVCSTEGQSRTLAAPARAGGGAREHREQTDTRAITAQKQGEGGQGVRWSCSSRASPITTHPPCVVGHSRLGGRGGVVGSVGAHRQGPVTATSSRAEQDVVSIRSGSEPT